MGSPPAVGDPAWDVGCCSDDELFVEHAALFELAEAAFTGRSIIAYSHTDLFTTKHGMESIGVLMQLVSLH